MNREKIWSRREWLCSFVEVTKLPAARACAPPDETVGGCENRTRARASARRTRHVSSQRKWKNLPFQPPSCRGSLLVCSCWLGVTAGEPFLVCEGKWDALVRSPEAASSCVTFFGGGWMTEQKENLFFSCVQNVCVCLFKEFRIFRPFFPVWKMDLFFSKNLNLSLFFKMNS